MTETVFPAEWSLQSGVQVTWPHAGTDWVPMLDEVTRSYLAFSKEILKREKLLVVTPHPQQVTALFSAAEQQNLTCVAVESNDTWARDHGGISVFCNRKPVLLDFGFNAWGLKFAAHWDNRITGKLYEKGTFHPDVAYRDCRRFILEGGAIESDGEGTILTTTSSLLAPNRNQPMKSIDIERYLKDALGAKRVLWLHNGSLEGDDTDGHIDTLVRFCNAHTLAYVRCDDPKETHYASLRAMEEELTRLVAYDGKPYRLMPLPMAEAAYDREGNRLPATYANFLIINGAVLMPAYGTHRDACAQKVLCELFPEREVVPIDCRPLIQQHGSLHCATMQFPEGFLS